MKNSLLKLTIIFILVLSVIMVTSCGKDSEEEKATNDLIGIWTIDNTSAELTVGGEDLVTYMTNNFDYTEQSAHLLVDFFTAGLEASNQGSIEFKEDNSYRLINSDGIEDGTWSLHNDGNTLTLVYENETDDLSILSLSASNLKLKIPTETEDIDLDDDGDNETTVEIEMELNLSK